MLEKLRLLCFDPKVLGCIRSYLTGRTCSVVVDGATSSVREVTSGVPQGSVLAAVLFLIYVNDITRGTSGFVEAFADDFKIATCFPSSPGDGIEKFLALQRDLDSICKVSESWNLKLNASKCVTMRFGNSGEVPHDVFSYYLAGTELSRVDHCGFA